MHNLLPSGLQVPGTGSGCWPVEAVSGVGLQGQRPDTSPLLAPRHWCPGWVLVATSQAKGSLVPRQGCQKTQVLALALSTTGYPTCALKQVTSSPFLASVFLSIRQGCHTCPCHDQEESAEYVTRLRKAEKNVLLHCQAGSGD